MVKLATRPDSNPWKMVIIFLIIKRLLGFLFFSEKTICIENVNKWKLKSSHE